MRPFGSIKIPQYGPNGRNKENRGLTAQEVIEVLRQGETWYSLEHTFYDHTEYYVYRLVRTVESRLEGTLKKCDVVSLVAFGQQFLIQFNDATLFEHGEDKELLLAHSWQAKDNAAEGWSKHVHLVTPGIITQIEADLERLSA